MLKLPHTELKWGNPECTYTLRNERLETSTVESELEILVNGNEYESLCPGNQEAQPFSVGHQAQPGKGEDGRTLLCTGVASSQELGAVLGATI